MIACLAPCDLYIDDNVNTLLYAAKAQVISNEPIVNDDPKVKRMRELQHHVSSLTSQLKQANKAIEFFKHMMENKEGERMPADLQLSTLEETLNEAKTTIDNQKYLSANKHARMNSQKEIDGHSEVSANFYTNR